MEFGVRGNPTPRAQQRCLPGSGYRPQSGQRSARNHITGVENDRPPSRVTEEKAERCQSRPDGVPGLNLNYLADEDVKLKNPKDLFYEYSLNTPGTASTVSWGTGRSQHSTRFEYKNPTPRATARPSGVPGLPLGEQRTKPVSARKPQPKEPSAWDRPACSENVRPPSARHKEMYQQYQEDLKQSYRKHVAPYHVEEDDVNKKVQEVKNSHPMSHRETNGNNNHYQQDDNVNDDEDLGESWTKQRYSTKQLMKKMDAEDLLEYNKKQKLIETVLADQLSRAVISDPEQDQRTPYKTYDQKRARGGNRFLHDSKVSTRATATENLLSKRVRFGARIISRNGHDALRELTGFFFHVDNTLTIYEFKQFGKSAKAIPFINRGQFLHAKGPRKGEPYMLLDIYSGSNIYIVTRDQHSLPFSLADKPYIVFRVINVDEDEKAELIGSSRGQETFARNQFPTKEDYENHQILTLLQETVQDKLKKRGIKTVTGLGRYYRGLDQYQTGLLVQHELEEGLRKFHIDLPQTTLDAVFEILDPDGEGSVDFGEYMWSVIGEMNEYRKSLVRKAFHKIDGNKRGMITLSDIRKFFNVTARAGPQADGLGPSAIQAFLNAVMTSSKQEEVSYIEFEEYYEGLSIGVDGDEDFANILRNTWTI